MFLKRAVPIALSLALSFAFAASCSSASRPSEQTVVLSDIEFTPKQLAVSVGDIVRFINQDPFDHDVYLVSTANPNDVLVTPSTIPSGEEITVTIDRAGLFTLYCTIHGGMSGHVSTTGSFELTEEERARAAALHVVPAVAKAGEDVFWGRAQCHQCHRMGDRGDGDRGPDLANIGFRAAARAESFGLDNGTEYIIESIMQPSAHLVEGYTDDMAMVYWEPINLTQEDLEAVVAYLQSEGGEVDTWLIDIPEKILATNLPENPYAGGDAERGKQVFEKMRCYSCHQIQGRAVISVGPDLTEIGAFRNWQWLSASAFTPNAEIGVMWQQASVHLKSGQTVTGTLRKNTSKEVQLLVARDDLRSFAGTDVESVEILEITKMPDNYEDLMSAGERADLIMYLQSLRGAGAAEDSDRDAASAGGE